MKPGILVAGGSAGLCLQMSLVSALVLMGLGCTASRGHTQPDIADVQARTIVEREPVAEVSDEPGGVIHVVERGQTLWRIARAYGVELDDLATINRIDDPTEIEVGLKVFVPRAERVIEVPPVDIAAAPRPGSTDWVWPIRNGPLLSAYGVPRRTHRHKGIDIGGKHGQPVLASRAGRVIYSGSGMRGYGKTVILDHGDGTESLYAHNSSLAVREGQRVKRGEHIARVGRTGNASADHCHFEIRLGDRAIDPMVYLRPQRGASR